MRPIGKVMGRLMKSAHRIAGLWFGGLIAFICLSGALVVYKPSLEKLCIPHLAYVTPTAEGALPLEHLYQAVKLRYPEHKIDNMVLYGDPDEAYSFRTSLKGTKGRRQIYVNQYTGDVLGEDIYDNKLMQWIYDGHTKLWSGKVGLVIVGVSGLVLLLLLMSGLMVLPKQLGKLIRVKSRKPHIRYYQLHIIVGLVVVVPLMAIAFTGAYWGFPEVYRGGFELMGAGKALAPRPKIDYIEGTEILPIDSILATAQRHFPEGKATMIFFPKEHNAPFSVRMRSTSDWVRTGSNHIYIHPQTGAVVEANLWETKPRPERLTRSMYFIHFGEFAGHWSRVLWIAVGLSVPLLYLTGLYLWIRRYRKRRV